MRKFKKAKVTGLAALMALSIVGTSVLGVGCGSSGGGKGDKSEVRITSYLGGFGTNWLDEAAARFAKKYENEEFEPGKKGVHFEISHTKTTNVNTMSSSAEDMYFVNEGELPTTYAQKGWLADINDIVTEKIDGVSIEDKINELDKGVLKGKTQQGTDRYVALPYASFHQGLSYDIDFFTEKNCYIAAEGETDIDAYTPDDNKYGLTVNFVGSSTAKKSKGIDNIEGTSDDGLPVSVQEFLVLCDYIKNEKSASPIHFAGNHKPYVNDFVSAVEASLSGYDEIIAARTFNGEIKCVEMENNQLQLTDEDVFYGIEGVKMPNTYTATISNENAHLTTQTLSRYYADALLYVLNNQGYFSKLSENPYSNIEAQNFFLMSGRNGVETTAMFIEGSYWYTETVENGNLKMLQQITGETSRNIGWFPLPVVLNKADYVAGEHTQIMEEAYGSFAFINANTEKNKPQTLDICKKFLQFLYSDEELSAYTGSCGLRKRSLNYTVSEADKAKLSSFAKSVIENVERSKIVGLSSNNQLFLKNCRNLTGQGSIKVSPKFQGMSYTSIIQAYLEDYSLYEVYQSTILTAI